ncbi:MAG: hypothetical protein MRJ93_00065 [Nitrososphaeraceae archaeon]|nr:hypothetical protein [Nitrososphaeraceae archaeon]
MLEDELNKKLLDKIIQNVISCVPIIEKMCNVQEEDMKKNLSLTSKRDFIVGAVWCTILEKFLVSSYLFTGKTISYDQGLELSQYILDKISKSSSIK